MKKKQIAFAAVIACTLALPALGSEQNPIERPFKNNATAIWTVDMLTGEATGFEVGVATHAGAYTSEAQVIWDLANLVIVSGSGVVTTDEGEDISWTISSTPEAPNLVTFVGGTGRFEEVSGSFAAIPPLEATFEYDWATWTVTVTVPYTGAGTIIY